MDGNALDSHNVASKVQSSINDIMRHGQTHSTLGKGKGSVDFKFGVSGGCVSKPPKSMFL